MSHELQMAYQFSQLTTNRDPDAAAIGAALDLGLFVVVMHHHDYCRFTDASLPGTTRRLASATQDERATYTTLEDAIRFCDQQNQSEDATEYAKCPSPSSVRIEPRCTHYAQRSRSQARSHSATVRFDRHGLPRSTWGRPRLPMITHQHQGFRRTDPAHLIEQEALSIGSEADDTISLAFRRRS